MPNYIHIPISHMEITKTASESETIQNISSYSLPVTESKPKAGQVSTEHPPAELITVDFPDGGFRAWLVVAASACGYLTTFGFINSWGVFQAYYTETILRHTSPSTIAWIGSVQYFLTFLLGPISGRLFDMGYFKSILFFSSCGLVAATFLVAECTKYWHFLLCQGITIGLTSGMIYSPMISVTAHWFKKKRGMALALLSLGSSIGGTVFPIVSRNLIPVVGFKWTMRILGFIELAGLMFCILAISRRLPPNQNIGPFVNLKAFKSAPYSVYCLATFVCLLGIYTILNYIDISAISVGVSSNFSFYLISIANASSGFGRIAGGVLADRVGPLNTMIPATLTAAILTYAWPFARSEGALIAISILYGASSGVFVALFPAPIMAMGGTHDVGQRVGMAMVGLSVGILAGPPIAGAISHTSGGYKAAGYYAGSICVLATMLLTLTRKFGLRRLWGKY